MVRENSPARAGDEIAEISNDVLKVKYPYFGGDIVCDPTKTTTILGKFEDLSNGGGTVKLIEDGLYKVGENTGGMNVLSFDGSGMTEAQQWAINLQWLTEATTRGDVIRVVSDPLNPANINRASGGLSFFGMEVKFLTDLGYVYNPLTYTYFKP
jgi:hypothetical protein